MSRVEISSKVRFFSNIQIANTNSTYAAIRPLGGLISIPGALRLVNRTGMVSSITLTDSTNGTPPIVLMFFRASVTGITDNTAITTSAANMQANFVGFVDINKSDWIQLGATSGSVATINNVGLNIECSDNINQTIYVAAITNAAYSISAANALKLSLAIIQD
jgi:hypothetical protein